MQDLVLVPSVKFINSAITLVLGRDGVDYNETITFTLVLTIMSTII